jgi:Polysaccharide lyase/Bacterial Ig domain
VYLRARRDGKGDQCCVVIDEPYATQAGPPPSWTDDRPITAHIVNVHEKDMPMPVAALTAVSSPVANSRLATRITLLCRSSVAWLRRGALAAALGMLGSTVAQAATATRGEDFEDGSIVPFNVEGTPAGNVAVIETPAFGARNGTKAHRLTWYQKNYVQTRASRSIEGSSGGGSNPRITSEGWYGFSFYLPSNGFPADRAAILGQIVCWHSAYPSTDKSIALSHGDSGSLSLNCYYGDPTASPYTTTNTGSVPLWSAGQTAAKRDRWHDLVVYVKWSNNSTGVVKAWLDDAPEASPTGSVTGIKVGNGAWTGPNSMVHGAYVKWGMYLWPYANTPNLFPGEVRTMWFDEVRYLVGNPAGAFAAVKPTVATPPPNVAPIVALTTPAANATATAPATITISADASDSDGSIARVEFFAGSTSLGVDDHGALQRDVVVGGGGQLQPDGPSR